MAKEDFYGNNPNAAASPEGGAQLIFDFPYGGANVAASSYIDAVTNLFYMNNVMYDVWYQYGFDEKMVIFRTIMNVVEQVLIMYLLRCSRWLAGEQKC
jgi:hypothetical protein